MAFRVVFDRWTGNDNFRGLLLAGILDIRRGMDGGPTGCAAFEAKYVGSVGWLGERCFSAGCVACFASGIDPIDAEAEWEKPRLTDEVMWWR